MGGDLTAELSRFRDALKPPRDPDELMACLLRILACCGQLEAAKRVEGWIEAEP